MIVVVGVAAAMQSDRVVTATALLRVGVSQSWSLSDRHGSIVVRDGAQKFIVPVAILDAPPTGTVGVPFEVDPTGSQAPRGKTLTSGTLAWGDGEISVWTGVPSVISHTYKIAGAFALTLTVVSNTGKSALATATGSIAGAVPYVLIEPEHLIYDGSFKVPDGFDYQGTALGFNAAANSLFIANSQSLGEITIPAIGDRASLLQAPVDPAEGLSIGAADTRIGGTLVYGDQLYFTKYAYYDATNSQTQSLFVRSLDLSAMGTVRGPYQVGPLNAGFYSGYMTHVPEALQGTLGGPVLTGNCCLNIITRTSFGPAAFALEPVTAIAQQNAAPLVYYPSDHPTLGNYNGVTSYFGGSDNMGGIVVPDGYGSVLFFGQHGTTFCYGGTECNDPTSPYQGVHGYPYLSYVWAFRVDDLGDVRSGRKQPWEIMPYATWTVSELGGSKIGGVAYDQARRKIYVSQLVGDGVRPLIHVYTIR